MQVSLTYQDVYVLTVSAPHWLYSLSADAD